MRLGIEYPWYEFYNACSHLRDSSHRFFFSQSSFTSKFNFPFDLITWVEPWLSIIVVAGPAQQYGVPVVHRRGPCSRLRPDQPYNSSKIFLRDKARFQLIASAMTSSQHGHNSDDQAEDMTVPVPGMEGDFLVSVSLGTPARTLTLILDTGSDLTWTQCSPCPKDGCYHQDEPYFVPSESSTFSDPQFYHSPSTYKIFYEDKSYSHGYYARDTSHSGQNTSSQTLSLVVARTTATMVLVPQRAS